MAASRGRRRSCWNPKSRRRADSMDWKQLWDIASAPDNVPIVALIPLLAFYIYLAWKQAHANDQLIAQLEAMRRRLKPNIARPGLFSRDGRKKFTCGRFCYGWSFWPPSSSPLF